MYQHRWLWLSGVVLWGIVGGSRVFGTSTDPNQALPGQSFAQRISTYHADAPRNGERLRVVYFTPSDAPPPEGYPARIARIVMDIQDFYLSEMKRYGFSQSVLPLEMENGQLKIHTVHGQQPATAYNYDFKYGRQIQKEIAEALAGQLNFADDFVLIICNLCTKRDDGSYSFNSPYYGGPGSDIRRGYCFVADCPMQDPLLLTDTQNRIVYEEHYGKRTQTLAEFNTTYLGGVAHELGHGMGLHHNSQTEREKKDLGTSLMGSGNHTYRRELWSPDKKGSFLTFASCLQLAVHPLFTQSDRGRNLKADLSIRDLRFSAHQQELTIEGIVDASPEALAIVAYSDPEEQDNDTEAWTDYDAVTWVGQVQDGRFSVTIADHKKSFYKLRLSFCHLNGDFSTVKLRYQTDASGCPDADRLNGRWTVENAERAWMSGQKDKAQELAKAFIAVNPARPETAILSHLLDLAKDKAIPELGLIDANSISLSDVQWTAAEVGWGKPSRNCYYFDRQIQDALFLEPGGVFHPKGLYAHAPSRYAFSLRGQWKRFEAQAGLQKGVPESGSAIFIVKGDGVILYQSPLLKNAATETIRVNLDGVDQLELITESGKNGNACCWSVWGSPLISR